MVYISELKINTNNETEPKQQLHEMKLIKPQKLMFWKIFNMGLFCSFLLYIESIDLKRLPSSKMPKVWSEKMRELLNAHILSCK